MGKKDRRRKRGGQVWSAIRAARNVVAFVRELVERYEDNPFMLMAVGHLEQVAAAYSEAYRRAGASDDEAIRGALASLG